MALVLMTALLTMAATALLLVAILPLPNDLRPWIGLAVFVLAGVIVIYILINRARSGEAAIRQELTRLFLPLGLSLHPQKKQASSYVGVYHNYEVRAKYAVSGEPQRPTYHLEIAVHAPTYFRLAIGMTKFRLQFDETTFGDPLHLTDPDYAHLSAFTDDPDAARTLLASLQVKNALLNLLSLDAPGVRNFILADDAIILRFRHHSFKRLNSSLLKRWVDNLLSIVPQEHWG
jgi:hypothetical protein